MTITGKEQGRMSGGLLLAILLGLAPLMSLANFEDLGATARPLGMGNAYTALATDVNALYYNPAGLAGLPVFEFTSSYVRHFIGLEDNSLLGGGYIAAAIPLGDRRGIGVGYQNFHLLGAYQEHAVTVGFGEAIFSELSVGLNLKGLLSSFSEDAYTRIDPLFQAKGYASSSISVDLGVMYQPLPQYRIALAILNANQPNMALSGEDRVSMITKLGFAYRHYGLDFAADLAYQLATKDLDFSVGIEKWFGEAGQRTIALRGGLNVGSREDRDLSIGSSFRADQIQFDYAFNYPLSGLTKTLGTHRFALSVRFGDVPKESEETFGIVAMVPKAVYDEEFTRMRAEADDSKQQIDALKSLVAKIELGMTEAVGAQPASVVPAASKDLDALKAAQLDTQRRLTVITDELAKTQAKLAAKERDIELRARATAEAKIAPEPKKAEPTAPAKTAVIQERTYTVKSSDTLQSIAKALFGDENKWVAIYRLNEDRIKQGILVPGQVLILPLIEGSK